MKVAFISFYCLSRFNECSTKYSLAVLRLAAYLSKNTEFDISILPLPIESSDEELNKFTENLNKENYGMIGMSAYVWTWDIIIKLSGLIKRNNNVCVCIGGPEVKNRDIHNLKKDIFVFGEGEKFVFSLCEMLYNKMSIQKIQEMNIIGNARKFGKKYFVDNDSKLYYDQMVFSPDFFDKVHIKDFSYDFAYYETTRGCPYNCGYCGHKTRLKTVSFNDEFIKKEIKFIGKFNIKRLFIVDPILGGTPSRGKYIVSLFNKYAPNTSLIIYLRPEYLDNEYIEILSKSKIEELRLGIQTVNKNVLHWVRSNNIDKLLLVLPKLTNIGIPWRAELITGLPGDDYDGLKNSIQFILENVKPTYLYSYHLTVLKDTKLFDLVVDQQHWIKIDDDSQRAVESYSYTKDEMIKMVQYSEIITALYNNNALVYGNKANNISPSFKELNYRTNKIMKNLSGKSFISYDEAQKIVKCYDENGVM